MSLRSSGIVLITTLLMMVLVVMFVTAVVYAGSGGMALSGNFYEREAALLAADSGVQYAMTRLQSGANWRGNSPTTAPEPRADFSVIEKDGNVIGYLSTVLGHKSQFRIKFNYEDGAGGADGLANTSDPEWVLVTPFVSLNNLTGASAASVHRARPDGRGVATGDAPYVVPRRTACLLVEGLAGWGLRDAKHGEAGNFLSNRTVVRRMVEAYLTLDESSSTDSAAFAAGDVVANLAKNSTFQVDSRVQDTAGRLRGLQDVEINGTGVVYDAGSDAEVYVGEGHSMTVDGKAPTGVTVKNANSADQFKRLTWEGIAKAAPSSTTDAQVKGGTYVWRMNGEGAAYLEYFDQEFVAGSTLPEAGTGTVVDTTSITTRGTGVSVDPGRLTLEVGNNVYVAPSEGGAQGFAVVTDPAVSDQGVRPSVQFSPAPGSARAPVLTASGSVRFEGSAYGLGSVTSEGDITFQGPSVLESDPETGVSLYAKGNISVEEIPTKVAEKTGVLTEFVSRYVKAGGDLDRLVDAVVSGTRLSGTTETAFRTAFSHLSQKEQDKLKGEWTKAIDGGAKKREAFVARLKTAMLDPSVSGSDQNLTGVLYTWKDFNANLGKGKLNIRGTLIAYGGDPSSATDDAPGTNGAGRITIDARAVHLTYDPSYIQDLVGNTDQVKVRRILWATY